MKYIYSLIQHYFRFLLIIFSFSTVKTITNNNNSTLTNYTLYIFQCAFLHSLIWCEMGIVLRCAPMLLIKYACTKYSYSHASWPSSSESLSYEYIALLLIHFIHILHTYTMCTCDIRKQKFKCGPPWFFSFLPTILCFFFFT